MTSGKAILILAAVLPALSFLPSCKQTAPEKTPPPAAAAPVPPPPPPLPTPAAASAPSSTSPPAPSNRTPPSTPAGVVARPAGRVIELSWSPSTDDVGVADYEVVQGGVVAARSPAPRASVSGLPAARPICFTVSALDAAGNRSPPSAQACATLPDVTPPGTPGGLAAVASIAPTEIDLTWRPAADDVGVKGYEVASDGKVVATVVAPSARATGLATSRRHCFTVVAVDEAGNRSPPSSQACASTPDVTAPSIPAGVVAEARPGEVVLRWQPSTDDLGVTGYEILRGETRLSTVQETTATVTGLRAAASHCFSVRALDAAGNRSPPSPAACATPPDVTPPSAPGPLEATSPTETDVVLSWSPATDDVGVAGYEIFRGDTVAVRTSGTRAGDTGLQAGTTYCYRIRAFDAAGNKGPLAKEACVTTLDLAPPTIPGSATAAEDARSEVRVRWEPSTDNVGVHHYEVRREGKLVGTTQGLTIAEGGLPEGRFHCYTVAAFDRAGNSSGVTVPACATIPDRTPPSVPGVVRSVATSGTQIFLDWRPSTDNVAVAGYEVLRDGVVVAQDGRPRVTVGRLPPETRLCFTVRAIDVAGNRSGESPETCARTAEAGAIVAPTNLQARAAGEAEILFTWDPSPEKGVVYVVFLDGDEKRSGTAPKGTAGRRIATTPLTSIRLTENFMQASRCFRVAAQGLDSRVSLQTLPACAEAAK